jgi:hypothetical protein
MKSGSDADALRALDAVFAEDNNRSFMKNVRGVFVSYFGHNRGNQGAGIRGNQGEPIREGKQGDWVRVWSIEESFEWCEEKSKAKIKLDVRSSFENSVY